MKELMSVNNEVCSVINDKIIRTFHPLYDIVAGKVTVDVALNLEYRVNDSISVTP